MSDNHVKITDVQENNFNISKNLIQSASSLKKKPPYKFFGALALIVLLGIFIRLFFPVTVVTGDSMYPTYKDNQFLSAISTSFRSISKDDIGIIKNARTNNTYFIKRVVGMPGDTLEVKNGILYVNGIAEDRDMPIIKEGNEGVLSSPLTLQENEYFLMGDNRNNSYDCRNIGPVTKQEIKYIVNFKLF